jgi:hypothetical protein
MFLSGLVFQGYDFACPERLKTGARELYLPELFWYNCRQGLSVIGFLRDCSRKGLLCEMIFGKAASFQLLE